MENNKFIINARSKRNGIIFYSNIFPLIGMEAFLDDSGNIQTNVIDKGLERFIDYLGTLNEEENTLNKRWIIIFDIIIIILSIIACVFSKNFGFVIGAIYFSAFVSIDLYKFINSVCNLRKRDKNGYYTAKFHGAEHKVLNAYKKLQRIPTLEEARKFSRFSKLCGSRAIIYRMFMFTLLTATIIFILHHNSIIYFITVLAIVGFVIICEKHGLLNFLQVFVTSKPSDKEINLAIEGLKQFEILENKLEKGESISFTMNLPNNIIPTIIFEQGE